MELNIYLNAWPSDAQPSRCALGVRESDPPAGGEGPSDAPESAGWRMEEKNGTSGEA